MPENPENSQISQDVPQIELSQTEPSIPLVKRPSWDEYFMKLAAVIAERSTCLRHHVGAVIVRDKRVLTTGYNGAVKGMESCLNIGTCLRDELGIPSGEKQETCRAVHAELNAINQAAIYGISIRDTTLYCTHTPCKICAKSIVNAGILRIFSYQDYADQEAREFLKRTDIAVNRVERPSGIITFLD